MEKSKWKETVWGAFGVSEKDSEMMMRQTRAAFELFELHTDTIERLFPNKDAKEMARIYAYAMVYHERQMRQMAGAMAEGLANALMERLKEDEEEEAKGKRKR